MQVQARIKAETAPGAFHRWHFREGPELRVARFWSRRAGEIGRHPGWEVALGGTSHRIPNPLFLFGSYSLVLRVLDSKSYSLSLSRHIVTGGIAAGAVDVFGGCGFSTLTVDAVHAKWSFGLLSPISTAGVGLRLGPVRLAVAGYVEYLWRWTQDDFWLRGVSVALSFDRPRHLKSLRRGGPGEAR